MRIPYRYRVRLAATYRAFRAWIGWPLPPLAPQEPLGDLLALTMRHYSQSFADNVTSRNALLGYVDKQRAVTVSPRDVIEWQMAVNRIPYSGDDPQTAGEAYDKAYRELREERRRDLGLGPIQ